METFLYDYQGSLGFAEKIDVTLNSLGKVDEYSALNFYLFSKIHLAAFNINDLNLVDNFFCFL